MIELTTNVLLAFIVGCAVGAVFTAIVTGWVGGKVVAAIVAESGGDGPEVPERRE